MCGCGRLRPSIDVRGRHRIFIKGHRITRSDKGDKSCHWKGGRKKTTKGYIMIRYEGHPRASIRGHYVFEHDIVMERYLGKYLEKGEVVHHINGIRDDNRIENLELLSHSDHARHHCIERKLWETIRR